MTVLCHNSLRTYADDAGTEHPIIVWDPTKDLKGLEQYVAKIRADLNNQDEDEMQQYQTLAQRHSLASDPRIPASRALLLLTVP